MVTAHAILMVASCSMMFIDFNEFIKNTEEVVKEVCSFVGAEPGLYNHKPQPPGMKVALCPLQPCPHCSRH